MSKLTDKAKNAVAKIDVNSIKQGASKAATTIANKAEDAKVFTKAVKGEIDDYITELDRMLESCITEYNDAFTLMNDKGIRLYVERCRSIDSITFVENLINSIANKPKSFDTDFDEIRTNRSAFIDSCEFADKELMAARQAVTGAGAGLAAGASVAFMGPTAAMWVATTFGTASTGTAISALSGAAASNAALAWLGGGALSAGGGGVAAGNAFLAMAGPIGWSIAGATLLSSIILFAKKKTKLNKEKNEEIESVKKNILAVKKIDAQLAEILGNTEKIRGGLNGVYNDCIQFYGKDYTAFTDEQKIKLGSLVNDTKALSALFTVIIE